MSHTKALLDFIDRSPSPYHAVSTIRQQLVSIGYTEISETERWSLDADKGYFLIKDDSSILAWRMPADMSDIKQFHIVGTHTDSPGFRIKPRPEMPSAPYQRLGVEIYGSPIIATFADRDLGFAGRVSFKTPSGRIKTALVVNMKNPLRLPNLAIHLNRGVNDQGLKFDKQTEIPLLFSDQLSDEKTFKTHLVELLSYSGHVVKPDDIFAYELQVSDAQPGETWGENHEFIACRQLDNLASTHAALTGFLSAEKAENMIPVFAAFDHEEIGSETHKGASSQWLAQILERIGIAANINREAFLQSMARSFFISVDMSHAYHPNFPGLYDKEHRVFMNQGPVIKVNANQRYATDSVSTAKFIQLCEKVDSPYQTTCHRTNLPCGSTIGPIVSAKLGMQAIDVGSPMWSMHSARESAGTKDHDWMIKVLRAFCADKK